MNLVRIKAKFAGRCWCSCNERFAPGDPILWDTDSKRTYIRGHVKEESGTSAVVQHERTITEYTARRLDL